MIETADFVILGAGVMGASIAYHLAERKAGKIVVLERDVVASGASGASSALVRMHYSYPPEVRLAVESLQYFRDWKERLGRPTHFRETGFFRIVPREEEALLRENVAMQRELGADARIVDRAELRELEPNFRFDDVDVAAYEPGSGYGDGATLANDFLDAARDRGALYLPRTPVGAIGVERGRVARVELHQGSIETPRVVVAAGAWSDRLFRAAGVTLPLETEYHEVLILERPPELAGVHASCIDSILKVYFRSEGRTQTLVGDFYGERGCDPDAPPKARPLEEMAEKVELMARRIPAMESAGLARAVTGTYTMTPDARGLLGPIRAVEGLYCCTGFSGMGFKIAPAVGLVMSEWVLDGAARSIDVSAFAPERFDDGRPIRAEFEYGDD